jgi:TPR repeat protein
MTMPWGNRTHHEIHGHIESICAQAQEPDCDPRFRHRPAKVEICPPQPCVSCEAHYAHILPTKDRGGRRRISWGECILALFVASLVAALVAWCVYAAWEWGKLSVQPIDLVAEPIAPQIALAEGGPCKRWSGGACIEAEDAKGAGGWARYYLRRGDAESALENWEGARYYYRAAVDIGSSVGAQPAIKATKRIQFQSMTCEYTDESLARISRDFDKNPLGALISMKQKQQALKALGYYNGVVDNKHGAATREAIRQFQDDLWFDEKGVLTAEQTVLLICGGAQIAKDIGSQNVLGVMYAGGLGVRQNTDFAMDWLEAAAQRGDADASWNLALLYGTGAVLSSVQICDAVQNAENADSYLAEAAAGGHPAAKRAKQQYRHLSPEERWRKLSGDLNQPEAIKRVGRGCNPNN